MSEHEHEWIPHIYDMNRPICYICGVEKMDWLEQELQGTREEAEKGRAAQHENALLRIEIERLRALGERYIFSDAQAQALLMRLVDYNARTCTFCQGFSNEHHPECRVMIARAYLTEQEASNAST